MAVKTITIDLDAYELLSAEKRGSESFSKVIKRRLRPVRTARNLLADIPNCLLSEDTLERVEGQVRRRGESLTASPIVDAGE
jgi:predicted CopG family antitoxin